MPSLAQQLRAERLRRERRRRVTVGVFVAVLAAVVGNRLVVAGQAEVASATSPDGSATATGPTATVVRSSVPPSAPTASPAEGLHPDLVDAFDRAQAEAAGAGHRLTITSGFRTAEEQAALLESEVDERGSLAEALWWVFPPETSMHVRGLAIDVGDGPAADWLADRGAHFGLCRTLDWEWWHFEWRQRWEATGRCPAPARTPAEAPRP